ncbi:hypothetical protein EDB89DRAFT_1904552 [Lactarius sanguifluus]|nr:hypothetical protein EDB89DRAFT_1904552 [Lactarius sanguifluus]
MLGLALNLVILGHDCAKNSGQLNISLTLIAPRGLDHSSLLTPCPIIGPPSLVPLEFSIRNKITEKAQRAYAPSFASTKIFVNTSNEKRHTALALVLVGVESYRLNLMFSANQCIKDDNHSGHWDVGDGLENSEVERGLESPLIAPRRLTIKIATAPDHKPNRCRGAEQKGSLHNSMETTSSPVTVDLVSRRRLWEPLSRSSRLGWRDRPAEWAVSSREATPRHGKVYQEGCCTTPRDPAKRHFEDENRAFVREPESALVFASPQSPK